MPQIPLPLRLDKHALFETFAAGDNAAAVAHVGALAEGRAADLVWLAGAAGMGKTHLLQAACRRAGEAGLRAMYARLGTDIETHPDQLLGSERLDFLALDDVDTVAGQADWEARLFSVLNEFHARGGRLVLAARAVPAAAEFALADLASRAAGAALYRLKPLDDEARLNALMRHAASRGLDLEPSAARFLLNRVDRGMPALCAWLDRLDLAALAARRRLTIPFIRATLAAPDGG